MNIRLSAPMTMDSIVDGPGLRAVIWTQGCKHNCKGCHNPQTHDVNGGFISDTESLKLQLKNLRLHQGITFSGGEPFLQGKECAEIAEYAHSVGLNVWCYTGFIYEDLLASSDESIHKFLNSIDVLVDGPFVEEQKSFELKFKGSKNQRILSLKEGKIQQVN